MGSFHISLSKYIIDKTNSINFKQKQMLPHSTIQLNQAYIHIQWPFWGQPGLAGGDTQFFLDLFISLGKPGCTSQLSLKSQGWLA